MDELSVMDLSDDISVNVWTRFFAKYLKIAKIWQQIKKNHVQKLTDFKNP